jgi:superfamily II DNA or RNA helicase
MPLRPDQSTLLAEVDAVLAAGGNPLVVAPTGAGKGEIIATLLSRGPSVLAVHRQEIVRDVAERVRKRGVPCRVLMGSEPEGDPGATTIVACVATIAARGMPSTGLLVIDEAHTTATAPKYRAALARHTGRVIGFTATPETPRGNGLGPYGFTHLVVGPPIHQLVAAGHIAPMRVYGADEETDGLCEEPVTAWKRFSHGLPGLVFASSVEHSKALTAAFTEAGYRAAHVDSDLSRAERIAVLERFKAGELDILCNYRLFTTGVDAPRAAVCMLASRVTTPGTYLQMLGRVRRAKELSILIDLQGARIAHGMPDDPRHYSLEGKAIGRDSSVVRAVQCRMCLAWGTGGRCVCGAMLPPPPLPKVTKRELKEQRWAATPREGVRWGAWVSLCKTAKERDYKPQWAAFRFKNLYGKYPPWSMAMALEE